jgi:hypothetical protein
MTEKVTKKNIIDRIFDVFVLGFIGALVMTIVLMLGYAIFCLYQEAVFMSIVPSKID